MMTSCCDFNFSAKLLGTFNDVYQRSNKSSGKKNLRCFPRCKGGVHKRSSFCGDAIEAQIMYSPISAEQSDVDIDELMVLGEFTSVGSREDLNSISLGDVESLKKIEEKIQHGAWFRSVMVKKEATITHRDNIDSAVSATVVFNVEKSWHYGWTSNRHAREDEHTFKVFALAPLRNTGGGTAFKCVGRYADGPKFRLSSTRRSVSRSTSLSPPPPKRGGEAIVPCDGGIGENFKRQKMSSTGASTSTDNRIPPQSTPGAIGAQVSPPLQIGTAVLHTPPTATDTSSFPLAPPRLASGLSFDNHDGTLSMRDCLGSIERPITSTPSSFSSRVAIPPPQPTPSLPLQQEMRAPAADGTPSPFLPPPPVPPRLVVGLMSFDGPDGKINLSDYLDVGASLPSIEPPITSAPSSSSSSSSRVAIPPQSTPYLPLQQEMRSVPAADGTPPSCFLPPPVPPRLVVGLMSFDGPDGKINLSDYLGVGDSLPSIEPPITSAPSSSSSSSCVAIPPQSAPSFSPLKQEIVVNTTMAVRGSAPSADKTPPSFPPVPPHLFGMLSFDSDGKLSLLDYLASPRASSPSAPPPILKEAASKKLSDDDDGAAQQQVLRGGRCEHTHIAPSSPGATV